MPYRLFSRLLALALPLAATAPAYAAEVSYDSLLQQQVGLHHEAIKSDVTFIDNYIRSTSCESWKIIARSAANASQQTLNELRGQTVATFNRFTTERPAQLTLRVTLSYGPFNSDTGRSPLNLTKAGTEVAEYTLEHPQEKNRTERNDGGECVPTDAAYPAFFDLKITNAGDMDGLPFSGDQFTLFQKRHPNGQFLANLTLQVEAATYPASSRRSTITASLIKLDVLKNDLGDIEQSFDQAYLDSRKAAREEAAKARQQVARQVPLPITPANTSYFDAWASYLSGQGGDVLPDGSKLRAIVAKPSHPLKSGGISAVNAIDAANNMYLTGWQKRDNDNSGLALPQGRRILLTNASVLNTALPISEKDYARIKPLNFGEPYRAVAHVIGMPVKYELSRPAYRDLYVKITEVWIIPRTAPDALAAERAPIIIKFD